MSVRHNPQQGESGMQTSRKAWRLVGVTLTLLALTFVTQAKFSQIAHAAPSCYGSSCTDLDPTTTVSSHDGRYCNQDAFRQEHISNSWGWEENWWSQNCNANWIVANVGSSSQEISFVYEMQCYTGTANGTSCSGLESIETADLNPEWASCNGFGAHCHQDIPWGAQHWYTNMADGSYPERGEVRVDYQSNHNNFGFIAGNYH
jgi:hypothetical protein